MFADCRLERFVCTVFYVRGKMEKAMRRMLETYSVVDAIQKVGFVTIDSGNPQFLKEGVTREVDPCHLKIVDHKCVFPSFDTEVLQ